MKTFNPSNCIRIIFTGIKWSKRLLQVLILPVFLLSIGCNKSINDVEQIQEPSKIQKSPEIENEVISARNAAGNKQVKFPQQDPGAPFYLRAGSILNQFFVSDGWLVIPFFRNPECVRADFNLLQIFDVPAAFSCRLTVEGFYMIENDAPLGTFPIIVQSTGHAVPFWFVRWDDFQAIAADGVVTIEDIRSLNPLIGVADKFKETLKPRMENHLVKINASGILQDGRLFSFHVTHVGDQTKSITLSFK